MPQHPPILENFVPEAEAAAELGLQASTLRFWRWQGRGPAYVKVGRKVLYSRNAIEQWLSDRERTPVCERGRS